MVVKVTRDNDAENEADEHYALTRWDRTLRLCMIRLAERAPALVPVIWLLMRR